MWTDSPALSGGGFELLLDFNWIIKGWGWLLDDPVLLGAWQHGRFLVVFHTLLFAPLVSLPESVGVAACGGRGESHVLPLLFQ